MITYYVSGHINFLPFEVFIKELKLPINSLFFSNHLEFNVIIKNAYENTQMIYCIIPVIFGKEELFNRILLTSNQIQIKFFVKQGDFRKTKYIKKNVVIDLH
ncbi:hypothetical protein BpHYR1_039435 [Brachionus plicatilis]|uniref:Uncharacterized protein n=1 Tax=Brachionus plicatilis TaxID=10195 RepID=A0A3M7PET3_BRAPC|nr:hypothetical protein BpHYR1_039435 [Brachionus plicatilis]